VSAAGLSQLRSPPGLALPADPGALGRPSSGLSGCQGLTDTDLFFRAGSSTDRLLLPVCHPGRPLPPSDDRNHLEKGGAIARFPTLAASMPGRTPHHLPDWPPARANGSPDSPWPRAGGSGGFSHSWREAEGPERFALALDNQPWPGPRARNAAGSRQRPPSGPAGIEAGPHRHQG